MVDDHVRMYEFEDTSGRRTWVSWLGPNAPSTAVSLPVRNDEVDTTALDYNGSEPTAQKNAEPTGWLNLSLHQRPVFVTETDTAGRPDLEVDTVKAVSQSGQWRVTARVVNHGGRATPHNTTGTPYPTVAVLRANGDSVAVDVRQDSIPKDDTVGFNFSVNQAPLPKTVLFSVTVNPGEAYVELGTYDNTGHVLATKP